MSTISYFEDMHEELAEAAKTALGPDTITVTVCSMNDSAKGQWILSHPNYARGTVADRLKLCARILLGEVLPDGSETVATPEAQRDFLAEAMRNALRELDKLNLEKYFDQVEQKNQYATTLLAMHDQLRPALNVLGLDYHKEH